MQIRIFYGTSWEFTIFLILLYFSRIIWLYPIIIVTKTCFTKKYTLAFFKYMKLSRCECKYFEIYLCNMVKQTTGLFIWVIQDKNCALTLMEPNSQISDSNIIVECKCDPQFRLHRRTLTPPDSWTLTLLRTGFCFSSERAKVVIPLALV